MTSRLRSLLLALAVIVFAAACSSTTTTTTTAPSSDEPSSGEQATQTSDESEGDESADEPTAAPADEPASDSADTSDTSDEPAADAADQPAGDAADTTESSDDAVVEPTPVPTEVPADDTDSDSSSFDFGDDGDFCRVARELDEEDPFEDTDIDPFSPEFYEMSIDLYDSILAIAPDEIRPSLTVLRDEIASISQQLAEIDFDFSNPKFGEIMQGFESGALDAAAADLENYLENVCGIDQGASAEIEVEEIPDLGLDPEMLEAFADIGPEEAALLLGGLGLDPELQACLIEQLPTLTSAEDPSILTQEICGTTLMEIVSGLSG